MFAPGQSGSLESILDLFSMVGDLRALVGVGGAQVPQPDQVYGRGPSGVEDGQAERGGPVEWVTSRVPGRPGHGLLALILLTGTRVSGLLA